MIDNFSILLSHGFLMLAFWFLLQRTDLNSEPPPVPDPEPEGFGKRHSTDQQGVKQQVATRDVATKSALNPYRKQRPAHKINPLETPDA